MSLSESVRRKEYLQAIANWPVEERPGEKLLFLRRFEGTPGSLFRNQGSIPKGLASRIYLTRGK